MQNIKMGPTPNPDYREICIREKDTNSGLLFSVIKTATIGDINAIVARALNCKNEISVQMSGVVLSNAIKIEDFSDADIKKITYTATNIKHSHPISVINTSSFTSFCRWNVDEDGQGNKVFKLATDNNVWHFNLNAVMPQKNDNFTPLSPLAAAASPPKLNPEKLANVQLEDYIGRHQCKLFKIEKGDCSYIKTIGVAKCINNSQSILIPSNSWLLYLVKGDTYNLFSIFNKDPSFGEMVICLGKVFKIRVGRVTEISQDNNETTFDIPLPKGFGALYDRVVVQYNKDELIVSSS